MLGRKHLLKDFRNSLMHKIKALCLLIRTEPLQNATLGRGRRWLQQEGT